MSRLLQAGEYFGESLRAGDSDLLSLSITAYSPYCHIEAHSHENPYFSLLTAGHYRENDQKSSSEILPGTLLFRPAHYQHANEFQPDGGHCFNIEFKHNWQYWTSGELQLPARCHQFNATLLPAVYKTLLSFNAHRQIDLENILVCLEQLNERPSTRRDLPCVQTVARIIDAEQETFHTLTSLAARAHVHPVYLSRIFKQAKGCTITEYQLRTRINSSLDLLMRSNLSVSDIAYRFGFYDDAHYIRNFKKIMGYAPHRFRLLCKS